MPVPCSGRSCRSSPDGWTGRSGPRRAFHTRSRHRAGTGRSTSPASGSRRSRSGSDPCRASGRRSTVPTCPRPRRCRCWAGNRPVSTGHPPFPGQRSSCDPARPRWRARARREPPRWAPRPEPGWQPGRCSRARVRRSIRACARPGRRCSDRSRPRTYPVFPGAASVSASPRRAWRSARPRSPWAPESQARRSRPAGSRWNRAESSSARRSRPTSSRGRRSGSGGWE